MSVRIGSRIETRLDEEHRRQLSEILEKRGWTISTFVLQAIEAEQQRLSLERMQKIYASFDAEALNLPPWDELKSELAELHCPAPERCEHAAIE